MERNAFDRRTVLRGGAGVLAAGVLAGCSGGGGSDESGGNGGSGGNGTTDSGSGGGTGTESGTETNGSSDTGTTASTETAGNSATDSGTSAQVEQWLAGASGYDGSITDMTGTNTIEIAVGAGENGFAFDPAAVRVSSGTTIRWTWTGKGGAHNVVAKDGTFDSGEIQVGSDVTYETTLDQPGTHLYYCEPHRRLGMKGAVVVSG